MTLSPSGGTQFSINTLSLQNRSSNPSEVQVALGFLMKDTPRHVLFRARVQLPELPPTDGVLHIGNLSSWCLAAAGDISIDIPLSIKFSPSEDDGEPNMQVAKAVQKEAMARAMRSGDCVQMRALAEKLQKNSAAEFKSDIEILLQLAQDFENRRDDARMNSMQMAQECSNNRSMQSASRFVMSKAAICSPSIVHRSKSASDEVSELMSQQSRHVTAGNAFKMSKPLLNLSPFQQFVSNTSDDGDLAASPQPFGPSLLLEPTEYASDQGDGTPTPAVGDGTPTPAVGDGTPTPAVGDGTPTPRSGDDHSGN
jgi:hypothetical protein